MRLFFLFLLIVNGLFALWIYFQPQKQAASVPPLPAGIAAIELLHPPAVEPMPAAADEPSEKEIPAVPVVEKTVSEQPRCYTLGPFADQADADTARRELEELADRVTLRKRAEREVHRYWVYIPSLGSRAQAIEVSKTLARNDIKDYYIVRSGDNNNAISLGHFREKKHADRRIRLLESLGFEVNKEQIYRQYDLFWLDFRLAASHSLEPINALASGTEGVARLERSCEP